MDNARAVITLGAVALVPAVFSSCLPPAAELRARADVAGHDVAALQSAIVGGLLVVAGVAAGTGDKLAAAVGLGAVLGMTVVYGSAILAQP